MAEDEVDFSKLSLEERCAHKNFKARLSAYEDLIKIFNRIDDEKSSEWMKWTSLVKQFASDSHAASQEKGLEAVLICLENSAQGPRLVPDVMNGIVNKCLTSTRARVKELAVLIVMMCIEIEKQELVQEELMKGMDLKNPRIVAACISMFIQAVHAFGAKTFKIKILCKKITNLLEDRDKNIRDESKKLIIELYRWIGAIFKQELGALKPALASEFEAEFKKLDESNTKQVPERYLRSQQAKKEKEISEGGIEEDEDPGDASADAAVEIDPFELLQPEEILSKLPKDFYDKIEAKKWQERKETLEAVETLVTKYQKLESGDYSDLVRALKRLITKDSNVVVIAVGIKCITGLATGLKKKFSVYAPSVMTSIFDKFKEKKASVLNPLKEASDAVFACTTLEAIAEDAISTLPNKNPSVKTEVTLFLSRAFSKTPNKSFTDKKFMKPFIAGLVANLNEPDPTVRDATIEALGVAYKAMGEDKIKSFLADVDPAKVAKVQQAAEKAVILPPAKEPKAASSKATSSAPIVPAPKKGPTIKKPATTTTKKKVNKPEEGSSGVDISRPTLPASATTSAEEVPAPNPNTRVELMKVVDEGLMSKLADKNWKTREEALDKIASIVSTYTKISPYLGDFTNAIILRLQDSNRNLASTAFIILQNLAGSLGPHCKQHLRAFLPAILSGLSENRANVRCNVIACLNAWAENTSVEEFFQGEMIADALRQPSPLLRTELFTWLAPRLMKMKNISKDDLASALPPLFSCIEDRNVDVRKSAQECVLGFMMHLGYDKMSLQAGRLKPSSKACVMQSLDKVRPQLPAKTPPSRGKGTPGFGGKGKGKPTGLTSSSGRKGSMSAIDSPGGSMSKGNNARSPPSDQSPSSNYGSEETLVISPPPLLPMGTDSVDVMSAEIQMPQGYRAHRNADPEPEPEPDSWNGCPKEYQVDFDAIARKHSKFKEPMPPLVLLETNADFFDNEPPINLPKTSYPKSEDKFPGSSAVGDTNVPLRAAQGIDLIIAQVVNPNPQKSMEALVQLEALISGGNPGISNALHSRIDQFLLCIIMQLRKMQPLFDTQDKEKMKEIDQLFRCIAHVLQTIYRQTELPRKASMDTVKDLMYICILILVDPTLKRTEFSEPVLRYFNILVVRIIERSDLNNTICACMRLLTDALNMPHFNRVEDLILKCQWKVLKQFTLYVEQEIPYDINIANILNEFYIFLKAHPLESWKNCEYAPLKTMKTIIHNVVGKLGYEKVYAVLLEKTQLRESQAGVYVSKLCDREAAKSLEALSLLI